MKKFLVWSIIGLLVVVGETAMADSICFPIEWQMGEAIEVQQDSMSPEWWSATRGTCVNNQITYDIQLWFDHEPFPEELTTIYNGRQVHEEIWTVVEKRKYYVFEDDWIAWQETHPKKDSVIAPIIKLLL